MTRNYITISLTWERPKTMIHRTDQKPQYLMQKLLYTNNNIHLLQHKLLIAPGARCKSKTGCHNQDRSRQNASVIGCAWLWDAIGLDCSDRSWICNAPQDKQAAKSHHITSHWDDRCRPRRPLYPRNNCLSYDFIIRKIANILHYGSRCHGDLLCSHTIYPDQTKTYLDGF